jgi:hypothetical protein
VFRAKLETRMFFAMGLDRAETPAPRLLLPALRGEKVGTRRGEAAWRSRVRGCVHKLSERAMERLPKNIENNPMQSSRQAAKDGLSAAKPISQGRLG